MCKSGGGGILVRLAAKIVFLALFFSAAGVSQAQVDPVVCSAGSGSFETTFRTKVKIEVGAARRDGLAVRMCQGALQWDNNSLVVAPSAFEVDVDAVGVDLGLGTPVVTFQVKQAEADCCSTLLIYSLQKPPKLLRTITGGSLYSTEDKNLNSNVEIWTTDAASMQGFEDPIFEKPGLAPAVVLRFVRGRLWNVGSEFPNIYDEAIAEARKDLSAEDLRTFKNSDGRLAARLSADDPRQGQTLQRTKIRVLQIVWSYLYSGREQEAWKALADLWPAADFERIKAGMIRAQAHGVLAHVDGTSTARRPTANTAKVFDLRSQTAQALPTSAGRRRPAIEAPPPLPATVLPVPIFIAHLASDGETEDDLPDSAILDLTIDSAGKVRSAQTSDAAFAAMIKDDTAAWKFVPAMQEDRPIACRVFFMVSPKR